MNLEGDTDFPSITLSKDNCCFVDLKKELQFEIGKKSGIDDRVLVRPSCYQIKVVTEKQSKQQGKSPGI